MSRRERLKSLENKIIAFNNAHQHLFNEHSRILIALPGLDLGIDKNVNFSPEKEIKEAERFAEYLRTIIGATVIVLSELTEIDHVLAYGPVDCLIDLYELHPLQREFLFAKLKFSDETHYYRYIELFI
ncbi:MAG: hypothetical protein FWE07_01695 [Turicibacter sp.]|nr:hypothetical protein [Turicibacter sp.]